MLLVKRREETEDLDQPDLEPLTPPEFLLRRTSPSDPNEFLLGDDEIDEADLDGDGVFDFDDILLKGEEYGLSEED